MDRVPVRYRQYATMRYFDMIQVLRDELSTEAVLTIVDTVQQMEEEYPEARIWDELRTAYVNLLLESGYPTSAIDFAKATKRTDYQKAQIVAFISKGAEDEAFELTTSLPDPVVMAEVLLEGEWSDDRGLLRLATIIEDDNYPAARRLACLVFVRNRMAANGETEMLARYDVQIEQLRIQIADKKSAE